MYICVCFIRNYIQYSTWCQNRGCSYISSTRRIYRSNPAVPCIHPEQSRITILLNLLILQEEEENKESVQSAIGSSILRAILPDRNSILHGSKALQLPVQGPREGFPSRQCILPGRNFILHGSAAAAGSPACSRACCSRRGFLLLIL